MGSSCCGNKRSLPRRSSLHIYSNYNQSSIGQEGNENSEYILETRTLPVGYLYFNGRFRADPHEASSVKLQAEKNEPAHVFFKAVGEEEYMLAYSGDSEEKDIRFMTNKKTLSHCKFRLFVRDYEEENQVIIQCVYFPESEPHYLCRVDDKCVLKSCEDPSQNPDFLFRLCKVTDGFIAPAREKFFKMPFTPSTQSIFGNMVDFKKKSWEQIRLPSFGPPNIRMYTKLSSSETFLSKQCSFDCRNDSAIVQINILDKPDQSDEDSSMEMNTQLIIPEHSLAPSSSSSGLQSRNSKDSRIGSKRDFSRKGSKNTRRSSTLVKLYNNLTDKTTVSIELANRPGLFLIYRSLTDSICVSFRLKGKNLENASWRVHKDLFFQDWYTFEALTDGKPTGLFLFQHLNSNCAKLSSAPDSGKKKQKEMWRAGISWKLDSRKQIGISMGRPLHPEEHEW